MAYTTDRYHKSSSIIDSPAVDAIPITTDSLIPPTRAVYVGSGGDLVVQMLTYDESNDEVTFSDVQTGSILPIRIVKVNTSNSSATNILALY